MKRIQLKPGQLIELLPAPGATVAQAVLKGIEFCFCNEVECTLEYDGFSFSLDGGCDLKSKLDEYHSWKKSKEKVFCENCDHDRYTVVDGVRRCDFCGGVV